MCLYQKTEIEPIHWDHNVDITDLMYTVAIFRVARLGTHEKEKHY